MTSGLRLFGISCLHWASERQEPCELILYPRGSQYAVVSVYLMSADHADAHSFVCERKIFRHDVSHVNFTANNPEST